MFRRGKLTFLTTKDDRVKIINERINVTEKHLMEVCNAFADCTRKLAKYRDSYDELARGIKSYADDEEINDSLSENMKNFTIAVTKLGDYMDLNVRRIESKVVNELAHFEIICKTTRDNIRTAVVARDKEVLKQRQMLELKSKFSANNSAADSELVKAKMEVNRANKEIDEIIYSFEKRKLTEVKRILTDFILISMKFHTKALEELTANYYDISNIDVKGDTMEFQKLLKSKDEKSKSGLKKGLRSRSQSMESLDRDHLLSPLKRQQRLSKSNKNLENDDDDEDDDDEDGEEEEEDSESVSNEDDEDESGTVSDNDDNDESVSVADAEQLKKDTQKSKSKSKDPFKAAASHVFKPQLKPRAPKDFKPFATKSASNSLGSQNLKNLPRSGVIVIGNDNYIPYEHDDDNSSLSDGDTKKHAGRVVTVVESKSQNSMQSGRVINCAKHTKADP